MHESFRSCFSFASSRWLGFQSQIKQIQLLIVMKQKNELQINYSSDHKIF